MNIYIFFFKIYILYNINLLYVKLIHINAYILYGVCIGQLLRERGAGGAFGVWIFTAWRRPLLSTLAPLGGSFLVVTALGFLLSKGLSLPLLPPQGAPWSTGAKVLLGPLGRGQSKALKGVSHPLLLSLEL